MNKQRSIVLLKMLLLVLLIAASCKKEIQQAPHISGAITDTTQLNIGDKLVLAPSITNLKGNAYTWLINGETVASGQVNYIFEAAHAGDFEIIFKVSNKGGTREQSYRIQVAQPIEASIPELPEIALSSVLEITPTVIGPERSDYDYRWAIGDSVISKNKNLSFISPVSGTFALTLTITAGNQTVSASRSVVVKTAQYIANAWTVLEFSPAPGKSHNWSVIGDKEIWQYSTEFPLPYNEFLAQASEKRKTNLYASLFVGSWGGHATFKFDHTVANVAGKTDLELMAYCSIRDMPAVYVAYDRNKNGKPDDNEWYELKTADYGLEDLPDYQITFSPNRVETDATRAYIYYDWADNQVPAVQGQVQNVKIFRSGRTSDGKSSTRGFFPGYYMDFDTKTGSLLDGWKTGPLVFKGKRITRDITGAAPFFQKFNLDIDQAVTAGGVPAALPGIDFVKVQKVVYPFQRQAATGTVPQDFNLDDGRMLQVASIVDKNIKK